MTLRGEVSNIAARRAAAQDARNTVGVWEVHNRLTVRRPDSPDDRELASAIRGGLERDSLVKGSDVRVSAHGGTVYLDGTVDSFLEKREAEDVAARISGVEDIKNWIAGPTWAIPISLTIPGTRRASGRPGRPETMRGLPMMSRNGCAGTRTSIATPSPLRSMAASSPSRAGWTRDGNARRLPRTRLKVGLESSSG